MNWIELNEYYFSEANRGISKLPFIKLEDLKREKFSGTNIQRSNVKNNNTYNVQRMKNGEENEKKNNTDDGEYHAGVCCVCVRTHKLEENRTFWQFLCTLTHLRTHTNSLAQNNPETYDACHKIVFNKKSIENIHRDCVSGERVRDGLQRSNSISFCLLKNCCRFISFCFASFLFWNKLFFMLLLWSFFI